MFFIFFYQYQQFINPFISKKKNRLSFSITSFFFFIPHLVKLNIFSFFFFFFFFFFYNKPIRAEWQPPQSAALSTPDPELRPLNTSARDNSARDSSSPQPHQLSSSQPSSLSSSPPPTASAASSAAAAGPQRKMSDNTHNSSSNSASPFSGAKPLLGALRPPALEAGHSSPGNLRQLQGPPPGRLGFAPRPAVAPPTRSATPPARSPPPARGSPPVVQPLSFREDGSGGGVVLPSAVSPRSRPRPPPGVGSNALRGPLRLGGPPPTPLKTPIVDRSERSLTTIDSREGTV
jgi:hypothetical protein